MPPCSFGPSPYGSTSLSSKVPYRGASSSLLLGRLRCLFSRSPLRRRGSPSCRLLGRCCFLGRRFSRSLFGVEGALVGRRRRKANALGCRDLHGRTGLRVANGTSRARGRRKGAKTKDRHLVASSGLAHHRIDERDHCTFCMALV